MTVYAIIDAGQQKIYQVDVKDMNEAQQLVGLTGVDHGMVSQRVGIVVYEFGLYEDPAKLTYFSLDGKLYGGNAVLYAVDHAGETIDLRTPVSMWEARIHFYTSIEEVEKAILYGVDRPMIAVNGEVLWQWPQPRIAV